MSESITPTIMIVEDDAWTIYLLRRYAERNGCRAISISAGEEAVAVARREQPALIVLDATLVGITSQEVLDSLRVDPLTRDIPVVLCPKPEDGETNSLAVRANACLRQPITCQDFLVALELAGVITQIS